MVRQFLLFLLLSTLLGACGTYKHASYNMDAKGWEQNHPQSNKELLHSLFLVGDTGEIDDTLTKHNIVLEALKLDLQKQSNKTSLVYLGDNIYPRGLPPKKSPERAEAEDIILAQLELARFHDGKTYFIPGNHDWNKHKPGGRKAVKRQEEFIEDYGKEEDLDIKFYPNDACADPKVVKINKDLVYIFIDTQWWLHDWSHENKINKGCHIKSRGDLLKTLEEEFVNYKNDEIVLMMHHPIMSDGTHGGKFGLKQHLFPLTELKDNLWIPIPIIGSLYAAYRKITGSKQDITNIHNKAMMQGIEDLAKKLKLNIVFASGHDHGMQYFDVGKMKHIVSGAGGKIDYVSSSGDAAFAVSKRGYVKLDFYEDSETWAHYYTIDQGSTIAQLAYRVQIRAPRPGTVEEEQEYPAVTSATKTLAANPKFGAGPIKKLFLGSQYRDMWTTPVEAEVIDLESKLGGLTPIKKGGGMASNSLRMEVEDGKHYILRSIKKDYTKLLPPSFKNLKIIDVLADQNSASHPYNALVIPKLSAAAGVYFTTPKLVYLQNQNALGNYNSQFAEELYLLEERPSGDWSEAAQFGNSEEIIGYTDLLDILVEKKNHFIDQPWVLKSRIFDLLIHDWDRHDDQWRWAKFDEGNKNIYRPIPRDRDQAFYKFVGIIPRYISTFVQKNFKTMKGDLKDVKHQSLNARHFDRYFLNDLEWTEWETIIKQMQSDIKDEDIDEAMKDFPKEILSLNFDEELAALLKERKSNLLKIGKRLYTEINQEVEITGSDNDNEFEIIRYDNGNVNVRYFEESKKAGKLEKYERTFYPEETKEIRLYGLRGKDKFDITGADNSAIAIRIIGGEDKDKVTNNSQGKKIYVYDEPDGITTKGKLMDMTSDELMINQYDRNAFTYDTNFPFVSIGNSVDDGWWFGGSMTWVNHGWRRSPYKSKNQFAFSFAPGSRNTLLVQYSSHLPDRIGKLDLAPQINVNFPYYENFFGLGNQSENNLELPIEYNWVRMQDVSIEPLMRANLGKAVQLDFGPLYQYRNILLTEDRVSEDPILGFSADELDSRHYLGAKLDFQIEAVDAVNFPTNGFKLNVGLSSLYETSKDEDVQSIDVASMQYFKIFNNPKLVFANQFGYHKTFGDRQFYHYQAIGNQRGLRGFRNERFRGHAAYYHNMDLRLKLFSWNNTILPMDVGMIGGYDYGRVRLAGIEGGKWHSSQTIGLWFEILGAVVVQPYYSFNDEQNTFSVSTGFNF